MALNQNEKDLLAVVKYYNDNRKAVVRLVAKLEHDFGAAAAGNLTGFTEEEIVNLISNAPKRKAKAKLTKVEVSDAEPTFDESTVAGRVAKELYEKWIKNVSSTSPMPTNKQLMSEFECTSKTVGEVNSILRDKGLIELAEPGNFRKGYVVK